MRSLKRRREELSAEILKIKNALKTIFPDSLESIRTIYLKLQERFKKYEIEIAEEEKSLISLKNEAEKKKTEYEKFIEAEKNDSMLVAEVKNLREELCSKLIVKKESWETEEQLNEKLIKKSHEVLSNIDKEAETLSRQYRDEETRFLELMKESTKQITILQVIYRCE
jgi:hypothetical protein